MKTPVFYGWVVAAVAAMVIGSSLGPMPFGIAYDLFNGYSEIILILIILPIAGSAVSLLSPDH